MENYQFDQSPMATQQFLTPSELDSPRPPELGPEKKRSCNRKSIWILSGIVLVLIIVGLSVGLALGLSSGDDGGEELIVVTGSGDFSTVMDPEIYLQTMAENENFPEPSEEVKSDINSGIATLLEDSNQLQNFSTMWDIAFSKALEESKAPTNPPTRRLLQSSMGSRVIDPAMVGFHAFTAYLIEAGDVLVGMAKDTATSAFTPAVSNWINTYESANAGKRKTYCKSHVGDPITGNMSVFCDMLQIGRCTRDPSVTDTTERARGLTPITASACQLIFTNYSEPCDYMPDAFIINQQAGGLTGGPYGEACIHQSKDGYFMWEDGPSAPYAAIYMGKIVLSFIHTGNIGDIMELFQGLFNAKGYTADRNELERLYAATVFGDNPKYFANFNDIFWVGGALHDSCYHHNPITYGQGKSACDDGFGRAMLSICQSAFSDEANNRLKTTIDNQWVKIMSKANSNSAVSLPTPNSYSICMSAAGLYEGIVKLAPEAVDAWHAANTYVHYLDPQRNPAFYSSDPNVCSKAGSSCQGCQSKTPYETGDFNLDCSNCAPGLVKDPVTGNCVKASSPSPSPSPDSSSPSPDDQLPDVEAVSAEECASQYINCANCFRNDDGIIKCDQCAPGYVLAGDTTAGGPPPGTCVDPCALLTACAACELPAPGTDLNDPSFIPRCAECMPGFMLMVSGKYGTIGTCVEPCKTMEHCVECQPIPPKPLKEGEDFPMCQVCEEGYHVVTNEEAGENSGSPGECRSNEVPCTAEITNCKACGYVDGSVVCKECEDYYKLENGVCNMSCDEVANCAACAPELPPRCVQCYEGYTLDQSNKCVEKVEDGDTSRPALPPGYTYCDELTADQIAGILYNEVYGGIYPPNCELCVYAGWDTYGVGMTGCSRCSPGYYPCAQGCCPE